jgi:hypothetical protein
MTNTDNKMIDEFAVELSDGEDLIEAAPVPPFDKEGRVELAPSPVIGRGSYNRSIS